MTTIQINGQSADRSTNFPQISSVAHSSYCKVGGTAIQVTDGMGQGDCSYIGASGLSIVKKGNADTDTYPTGNEVGSYIGSDGDEFVAGAISDLIGDGSIYDSWLIDHNKYLINHQSGL